jgi:PAS domain S-box-containing protein
VAKDGRHHVWEYRNTLRTEGVPYPVVRGMAHDVTERKQAEEALRQSEQRMRLFIEHAPAGAALLDREMRYVQASRRWREDYGLGDREIIGISHYELFPEIPERWKEAHRRCLAGEVLREERDRFERADGTVQWIQWELHPWYEKGQIGGIAIFAEEVTAREVAADALRKSEERYRMLFEKTIAGVGIITMSGMVLDCNDAWARMFGHTSAADCRGGQIQDYYRDTAQREPLLAELCQSGVFVNRELELRRKDGTPFWVLLNSVLISQSDGKPLIQSTMFDITERKKAEQALRKSEERFRVALKDSPITVFNQDRDLRYSWIYNPQLYWQHDVLGKTDDEIIGPKKAAALNDLKRRVLASGVGAREEVAIPQNGTNSAFDITIEPLVDAEKNVIGITAACMDIARLREMADRLQESRDSLANTKCYLESEIQTELGFEEIIGQSPALREVLRKARIVAPTDSTVLLLGETGTGKELVARSVHALSSRCDHTFVKLNCAAVPSGLLESELFGHEKGAFTGAVNQKVGRIELADKGTLFLDEIGEMPPELQPKLLRVLQDREFERLGGIRTLRVDLRIISATNRDLHQDVADKKFREDLFYRLNVFPIELPPLRERRDDIAMLVQHFVRKHSVRMGKRIETIPDDAMRVLRSWNWPGNVRELENVIERMVIMSKGSVLFAPPAELSEAEYAAEDNLTEMEREHILRVLRETGGVLSGNDGAASRLGLKRTTLQSMIKRLGIHPQEYRNGANGMFGRP